MSGVRPKRAGVSSGARARAGVLVPPFTGTAARELSCVWRGWCKRLHVDACAGVFVNIRVCI